MFQKMVVIKTWLLLYVVCLRSHCLGQLLIYINDLNEPIMFCKVHHFADDTNLLYFDKLPAELNQFVNLDTKNLIEWSNAYKISLNVQQTKLVMFKHQKNKLR